MAPLFAEMILATARETIVLKKIGYLYIARYAETQPELALLAVNTLRKDSADSDPMIRGLALRTLSSLRVANLTEYLKDPIQKCLADASPYVRKVACVCCLKLYHLDPHMAKALDVVAKLFKMLTDKDPLVVSNSLVALQEILKAEGGLRVPKPLVVMLLKRFRDFNEWSHALIIELICAYQPESEADIFEIMNFLDHKLRHSNTAVVLSTAKLFLTLTQTKPAIYRQVFERLRSPMVTSMTGCSGPQANIAFTALQHIQLMIHKVPGLFDSEFRAFFPRVHDPEYLKLLKIKVLPTVTCAANLPDVIEDLSSWVFDSKRSISRAAIFSVAAIAKVQPDSAQTVIQRLIKFISFNLDTVTADTLQASVDVLRRFPQLAEPYLAVIPQVMQSMPSDSSARAALLWVLGQFGDRIEDAPYMMEELVEDYDELTPTVKLELLSSAVALFFKRPAETRPCLGKLFAAATIDGDNVDVHDRALFYYRLLQNNISLARSVVAPFTSSVSSSEDTEMRELLFGEYGTLSVLYQKPSVMFIKSFTNEAAKEVHFKVDMDAAFGGGQSHQPQQHPSPIQQQQQQQQQQHQQQQQQQQQRAPAPQVDLLGDLLGDFGAPPAPAAQAAPPLLLLETDPQLPPEVFKQAWKVLPDREKFVNQLSPVPQLQQFLSYMQANGVKAAASGVQNGAFLFVSCALARLRSTR
jgi:vesicle coat complex subunit